MEFWGETQKEENVFLSKQTNSFMLKRHALNLILFHGNSVCSETNDSIQVDCTTEPVGVSVIYFSSCLPILV